MTPYYQDENVTIYHADAMEAMETLSGTAIITDPPYGVGIKYGVEYNDARKDYWEWFAGVVAAMRANSPTVAFTHRLAALRHFTDWDWLGVWNKPRSLSGLVQFPVSPHWEPIFLYGIQGRKDLPRRFDVLSHLPAIASKSEHPAPKPVSLYHDLINWLCPEGVVFDPFMGSGTTLRAAKDLGRRAIGVEIEEKFCEVAAKRLCQEVLAI